MGLWIECSLHLELSDPSYTSGLSRCTSALYWQAPSCSTFGLGDVIIWLVTDFIAIASPKKEINSNDVSHSRVLSSTVTCACI